ncbi:AAA family ATPase [Catellatospora chokoriensis]|uniref:AAA domain-containing protein n=1 Tax=Catellatospora chokoriensis TaxID=310353 RepID=A0A8J3K6M8_9ACTN|nr:AAA family ATPase [Catellatospora chokoriensis]GIF91665.1 hypothetical protein Cch02nite_51090 [Catellatospora chokoriensis]
MLVVLVNGLPGAGKTTLARELGHALRLPVFAKDAVKETLADHLPGQGPEWSRSLGVAAGETLWTLLAYAPGGAVLESPWLAHLREVVLAGLARAAIDPATVHEVWCDVPVEIALRRYEFRAPGRHPVHRDTVVDSGARFAAWAAAAVPLGVGTLHRVDTTGPVDVAALAGRITGARAG